MYTVSRMEFNFIKTDWVIFYNSNDDFFSYLIVQTIQISAVYIDACEMRFNFNPKQFAK